MDSTTPTYADDQPQYDKPCPYCGQPVFGALEGSPGQTSLIYRHASGHVACDPPAVKIGAYVLITSDEWETQGSIGQLATIGGWKPDSMYVDILVDDDRFMVINQGDGPYSPGQLRELTVEECEFLELDATGREMDAAPVERTTANDLRSMVSARAEALEFAYTHNGDHWEDIYSDDVPVGLEKEEVVDVDEGEETVDLMHYIGQALDVEIHGHYDRDALAWAFDYIEILFTVGGPDVRFSTQHGGEVLGHWGTDQSARSVGGDVGRYLDEMFSEGLDS